MPQISLSDSTLFFDVRQVNGTVPLMLLHAALGTHQEVAAIRAVFQDRTTYTLDLPGHGNTTTTAFNLTTESLAKTVLEFMDTQGLAVADFIGYSMGGYVALEIAVLHPERVRSVVVHATKFYWTPEIIASAGGGLSADMLKQNAAKYWASLEQAHTANGAVRTCELVAGLIQNFSERTLSAEAIRETGIPVLLSIGDSDELIPLEEVHQLYETLTPERASLTVLPNTRHAIRTLPVVEFEAAVRHFWRSSVTKSVM